MDRSTLEMEQIELQQEASSRLTYQRSATCAEPWQVQDLKGRIAATAQAPSANTVDTAANHYACI